MEYRYEPEGVCAFEMVITVEDSIIKSVNIIGGCPGNALGVAALVKGMTIEDAIERLKGIDCRGRGTSCPDQLSKALEEIKNKL